MRIKLTLLAIAIIGSLTATTSQAVDWDKFWGDFHLVKQRNNAWPQPFLHRDQQAYFGTINPMIDAGWHVECTLASHHFDVETQKLNNAGEAKLVSILRTIPKDRQQIYIVADQTHEASVDRMQSVRDKLASWSATDIPVSTTTNIYPSPQTGSYVEGNYGAFQSGVPQPSLGSANVGSVEGN